ncbi:Glycine betaine/L-proline transport ATP-binding protein ProV [uncultured Roseburia sp.]|uniref:ABC transporter ATP-binding protein n=1 Tax=Brotonthovivens ammoniilytica TaxID=2981725 RepID=A0ABT2TLQ6_9FIRM|nr:ABC transporter ATP-binding protein [Brotonthovivens ammoniilytica]MCU6763145.1 ABC transporter ATP-binding protein [Brotonthovivens ammoniilytica]SCJ04712.1 Glycine betaine/L-proline transport ATP-binding protein ProV [uncultured Roseburia sp.]
MEIAVEFKDVTKKFPQGVKNAVNHVSFQIRAGELVTILGTSGCGKTTLMKMVNRLYEPTSGEIFIFGENIRQKDPVKLRQGIGYVIQQIGLFPHMTVAKNIAVVPEILNWEKESIESRTHELLRMVNLDPEEFCSRYPAQLSGGQQQRVGLARALAADPKIMLLDEPFGAIDAINRGKLQDELLSIHQSSQKTFLFVTHDITEALKLGTRVLIMDQGEIKQFAPPREIVNNPANEYVASLMKSVVEGLEFLK